MSIPSPLQQYHFHVILIWWHRFFNFVLFIFGLSFKPFPVREILSFAERFGVDTSNYTLLSVHNKSCCTLDLTNKFLSINYNFAASVATIMYILTETKATICNNTFGHLSFEYQLIVFTANHQIDSCNIIQYCILKLNDEIYTISPLKPDVNLKTDRSVDD